MVKGGKKLFTANSPALADMVNLRKNGLSMASLGALYGRDFSSIRHLCHLYNIPKPPTTISLTAIISQIIPKQTEPTFVYKGGERINLGRNYSDYIPIGSKVKKGYF